MVEYDWKIYYRYYDLLLPDVHRGPQYHQCVVSCPTIAERLGISVNTVAKYVGQLEEHGLTRTGHTDIFTKDD